MGAAKIHLVACCLAIGWACLFAGQATGADPGGKPNDFLHASKKDLQWWREAKFGLFIHWGPVSIKGTEIGWSRGGQRRGRAEQEGHGPIPVEVYDHLYEQFNPVKFDAKQWVAIAKAAGMKYLVFTTKHHDGFSMFDSKLTDHKITASPFKRDVVSELAEACQQGGLRLGFYYSPVDWHHPDYRTENHSRYIEFMHGQIRELCSNYGRLDIMWFDGLGGSAKDWDSVNMFKMIRQLQPHIIINNRAGLPADYDTPEQQIGEFRTDRAWETCMTIGRQWAWKPEDKIKSLNECVATLVKVVGGDGNLLLNVGPMPTGEIEPRQVVRLKEIGQWLKANGESIYGTRGGPFERGPWGAATYKENKIYVHILDWKQDPLVLPPITPRIVRSSMLTGETVPVEQADEHIKISVPQAYRQEIDTIVVLELDGPASQAAPISTRPAMSK